MAAALKEKDMLTHELSMLRETNEELQFSKLQGLSTESGPGKCYLQPTGHHCSYLISSTYVRACTGMVFYVLKSRFWSSQYVISFVIVLVSYLPVCILLLHPP